MTGNETVLICEDSAEGILTGIYDAYRIKKDNMIKSHDLIHLALGEPYTARLFTDYIHAETDFDKAAKVSDTIKRQLGGQTYYDLCLAMASCFEEKADAVYHTVVIGLKERDRNVLDRLGNDYVQSAFKCYRAAGSETNRYIEFIRFSELENGILYAKINTKHHVLPFVMPHFSDRLPADDFVIYDEAVGIFGLHPRFKQWYIAQGMEFDEGSIRYSAAEYEYRELFKRFCESIAIESRINEKLQQSMLPLRFRPEMTEFSL